MSILGFLIVVSLLLGAAAWLFFVWTVRSGQYEDPEGAKYRMLEDEEPASPGAPSTTQAETPAPAATPTAASTPSPPSPPQAAASPTSALATTASAGAEASPGLPRVPPSRRNGVH